MRVYEKGAVISSKTLVTLKAGGYFELESLSLRLRKNGWIIEKHPQFCFGEWTITMSRERVNQFNVLNSVKKARAV